MEDNNTWNGSSEQYANSYNVPQSAGSLFDQGGLGFIDDFHSTWLFGDKSASSNVIDEILGINSQKREFAQQEYLQDKQNAYNDPSAQMARMKAAGINPNVAASAIAQGGNESAQAPTVASTGQGAAAGLGAIGSAVGGIAGAGLSIAQKKQAESQSHLFDSQSNEIDVLLDFNKAKIASETAKNFTSVGLDSAQADYWSTKAVYAGVQERLDIQQKGWAIQQSRKELKILDEEYKIKKEEAIQAGLQSDILAVDKWFQDERKRIYLEHGVDVNQTEDAMLVEADINGFLDRIVGAFSAKQYEISKAGYDARVDTIAEETRLRVQEELKARISELVKNEEIQKELIECGVKGDMVRRVFDLFTKYLFGVGVSVNVGKVGVTNSDTK